MRKVKITILLILLSILLALFVFRVISQLMQIVFDIPFLVPLDRWDSGTVPYSVLLFIQIVIIVIFMKSILKIYRGSIKPNKSTGYTLIVLGFLYFIVMTFRLVAGLTYLNNISWFVYPIPSIFHLILALSLILFGYYYLTDEEVSYEKQD